MKTKKVSFASEIRKIVYNDDILFDQKTIKSKVNSIANNINSWFSDEKNLILVGVLDGCYPFLTDLSRKINVKHKIETIHYKSYSGNTKTMNVNHIKSINKNSVVIIVDDISDSGDTFIKIEQKIKTFSPKQILFSPLIERYKSCNPKIISEPLIIGSDAWIYGYGLDDNGYERNNPCIYKKSK